MKEAFSDVIEVRLFAGDDNLQVLQNQKQLLFNEQTWMDLSGEEKLTKDTVGLLKKINKRKKYYVCYSNSAQSCQNDAMKTVDTAYLCFSTCGFTFSQF